MFGSLKAFTAITLVLATACLISIGGCGKTPNPWDKVEGGNLKVLVTFPPLYCFTKAVADKDAKVQTLLASTGPHEHQATASDAHLASGANVFFSNGLTLDDFVTKIANSSGNRGLKVVKVGEEALASKHTEKEPVLLKMGDHDHGHEHHGHDHGDWDPHAWLGIEQAILIVEKIRDTLKQEDSAHAADYDRRSAGYIDQLKQLQDEGKKLLAGKKNRKLISMHDSLGYFCKSFDLERVDSIMPRPGVEADAKKLAQLMKECKSKNVAILAVEPQYSQERATTLRDNLSKGGHTLAIVEIDPLETAPADKLSAEYYIDVMRKNLKNLAEVMK